MKMWLNKHSKPAAASGDSQPVTPADVDPLETRLESLANTLSLVSAEQVISCFCRLPAFDFSPGAFQVPRGCPQRSSQGHQCSHHVLLCV